MYLKVGYIKAGYINVWNCDMKTLRYIVACPYCKSKEYSEWGLQPGEFGKGWWFPICGNQEIHHCKECDRLAFQGVVMEGYVHTYGDGK